MRIIGLTGGIGSGKSTVAEMFAERGAEVIDADRIAREVLEPGTDGLAEVVSRFGEEVLLDDGRLDREALASIVFSDERARTDLNAIVHPRVGREITRRLDSIQERGGREERVVVLDVPLLVESASGRDHDAVVVVTAPVQERVRRLHEQRGMDPSDVRARIASQASDEQRLEHATHVIDNSGDREQLEAQVADVWHDLVGERP